MLIQSPNGPRDLSIPPVSMVRTCASFRAHATAGATIDTDDNCRYEESSSVRDVQPLLVTLPG